MWRDAYVRHKCSKRSTSFLFISLNWLWAFDISQFYLYLPLFIESFEKRTHTSIQTLDWSLTQSEREKRYAPARVRLYINYRNWSFLLRQHNISEHTRIDGSYLETRIILLSTSSATVRRCRQPILRTRGIGISFREIHGNNACRNLMRKLIR